MLSEKLYCRCNFPGGLTYPLAQLNQVALAICECQNMADEEIKIIKLSDGSIRSQPILTELRLSDMSRTRCAHHFKQIDASAYGIKPALQALWGYQVQIVQRRVVFGESAKS